MDVDHRQVVRRRLYRVAVVMRLHELVPARRRASRRRQWRRLERLAQVHGYLPDRRGVGDEGDQSDVTAAGGAHEREVFRDPRDELGRGDSRGVVGTGISIPGTLTSALSQRERERGSRERSCFAGTSGCVADREGRDGGPQRVVRGEDAVVTVPVLSRRGHEIGKPVQELCDPPTGASWFRPTFDRAIFQASPDELPVIEIHSL